MSCRFLVGTIADADEVNMGKFTIQTPLRILGVRKRQSWIRQFKFVLTNMF